MTVCIQSEQDKIDNIEPCDIQSVYVHVSVCVCLYVCKSSDIYEEPLLSSSTILTVITFGDKIMILESFPTGASWTVYISTGSSATSSFVMLNSTKIKLMKLSNVMIILMGAADFTTSVCMVGPMGEEGRGGCRRKCFGLSQQKWSGLYNITVEILCALTIKLMWASARIRARVMSRARDMAKTRDRPRDSPRLRARDMARAMARTKDRPRLRARAMVSSTARGRALECAYV